MSSREDTLTTSLDKLLVRFARARVLVLGDMVADEYIVGRPARISREAPVLILHHSQTFIRPGGATNPAYNISSLHAHARVVGVVGDDAMAKALISLLDNLGIHTGGLIVDSSRPTSTKTRVVGKGIQEVQQQIVRIDRVDTSPIEGRLRDRMIDALTSQLDEVDALLVSDYENGVISQEVISACLPRATARGIPVIVDSHGDLFRFKGVTAATPNQPEAEATVGRVIHNDTDLDAVGDSLVRGMDAGGVLITRGSEGVALYRHDKPPYKLPIAISNDSQVVDPTGAGDTVAAIFTLSLISGSTMPEATYLANVAGGEVVRRLGAVAVSADDLRRAVRETHLVAP